MKGYLSYFKTIFITGLQYKQAALAGIATQFFWGFLQIFIYEAFYMAQGLSVPISYKEIVTYVWLQQSFYALTYIRYKDSEFIQNIKNGSVAYELIKPYNMYVWWYIKCLAKRTAAVLLRCVPVLIMAIILPAPYNLVAPESLSAFILFIITLILGSLVLTGIILLIQMISLFTNDDKGIAAIINTLAELLAGQRLPIPLLPNIIQKLTYILPFGLIGDLPFRLYSGNIPTNKGIQNIYLQLIWIVILILAGSLVLRKATKKMYIQGG